jgi:hypothetical protein
LFDVPTEHQRAAEQVRAHLVAVRGGAPFLSPRDSQLLLSWLDDGIGVATIVCAVERAAELRAARRSRLPLTLGQAKRHLGRHGQPAPLEGPTAGAGRLQAVASALRDAPGPTELRPALDRLASSLEALGGGGDRLVEAALEHVSEFLQHAWDALGPGEQRRRMAEAIEELGDLADVVGEDEATLLAEESARSALRASWPALSAATLWTLAHAEAR